MNYSSVSNDKLIKLVSSDYIRSDKIHSYEYVELLINRIQKGDIRPAFNDEEIKKVRTFCNLAECDHEIHWAKKLINSENPQEDIKRFPKYEYYNNLISLEIDCISYFQDRKNLKVVFVGGGAMPLSAIILAAKFEISSVVLEIDDKAINLAKNLIKKLGLSNKIKIMKARGEDFNYFNFNLIFLAVMAGVNEESKLKILRRINKTASKKSLIMARSSYGKIKYIYQSLPEEVFSKFALLMYIKPYKKTQVSHYIFEV
jgi:nicotianamine synthase